MAFPKNKQELEAAGYHFQNSGDCRGCGRPIEWWQTPHGKMMPLDADYQPHWASCPNADEFRARK